MEIKWNDEEVEDLAELKTKKKQKISSTSDDDDKSRRKTSEGLSKGSQLGVASDLLISKINVNADWYAGASS